MKDKIKEFILGIPVAGKIIKKGYRLIVKRPFTNSSEYWENRYQSGGNSGSGSYNQLAEFKAEVINQFVSENNIINVIEFGCGDGNQLVYFNFGSYIGFDISPKAVEMCRIRFLSDQTKRFDNNSSYKGETADLVLSLDVIYHLVENGVFNAYMTMLFNASTKYVIIYSSNNENHPSNNIYPHVRHRRFTAWIKDHAPHFELIKFIPNKYPFNGDDSISSNADFYIYKKKQSLANNPV